MQRDGCLSTRTQARLPSFEKSEPEMRSLTSNAAAFALGITWFFVGATMAIEGGTGVGGAAIAGTNSTGGSASSVAPGAFAFSGVVSLGGATSALFEVASVALGEGRGATSAGPA